MIISSFFSTILARITAHLAYRRTLRELSALDDRALHDLGLFRDQIENVARGLR